MITIIIDGKAGELRLDETALRYLESDEVLYIRRLCEKLKERVTNGCDGCRDRERKG